MEIAAELAGLGPNYFVVHWRKLIEQIVLTIWRMRRWPDQVEGNLRADKEGWKLEYSLCLVNKSSYQITIK
jgi:hypothetical protein